MSKQMKHRGLWIAGSLIVVAGLSVGGYYLFRGAAADAAAPASHAPAPGEDNYAVRVDVAKPKKGGLERLCVQQATVQAEESVDLYSMVAGFLAEQKIKAPESPLQLARRLAAGQWELLFRPEQKVDIGTRVWKGAKIAKIAVPEQEAAVKRATAEWKRTKAAVEQMAARIRSAEADLISAHAGVVSAQATKASAAATLKYRKAMYTRLKNLYEKERAIEAKVVDEEMDRLEAAEAAHNSAEAGVHTAEAQVSSAEAKLASARADLDEAKEKVGVAEAELEKAQTLVDYSVIYAPFDGVITKRNFFPGDFIASANNGGHVPLLSVDRTDKLRVVVQVPDRDVPYTNVGDEARLEIDALPQSKKKPFTGVVSRVADSEDPHTRNMRTEIDLPNPTGELRAGMYGRVSIVLQKGAANALTIPSAALVGRAGEGKGSVYVVRGGKAHLVEVRLGADDGLHCEVISGLNPEDQVIVRHGGTIEEGTPVTATPVAETSGQQPAGQH